MKFDALIVGAGVAGCATAIELLSMGWRIGILCRRDVVAVSGMESLPPEVASGLTALPIHAGSEFSEVVAWWGSARESRSIWTGGRIVERVALAGALRTHAVEHGATVIESVGRFSIERIHNQGGFVVGLAGSGDRRLTARYLVDATGQASAIGRRLGSVRLNVDHLFCVSASVEEPGLAGTWTESTPRGWWNLCCTRERGTLSFFSAAKVIRETKEDIIAGFYDTENLCHLLPAPRLGETKIRRCGSSRTAPCAGPGWVAVGDAASTLQPLASAGISKALRDARAVPRALEQGSDEYDRFQRAQFDSYVRQLAQQYALEGRWPQSQFWATSPREKLNPRNPLGVVPIANSG
jgi:2-polyprenyl-6-methoxyphenol hydroxylase-like FAD-dependent oxidoreductase